MKRRNFINALAALSGVGVLTGLYTWQVEPFWLEFVKVKINPGETQKVTFKIIEQMLSFYDVNSKKWKAEWKATVIRK